jgi:DNA-directed RNA polymerase II subunit RPB3
VKTEWPVSANGDYEQAPKDGAVFDYNAKPNTFYFNVESTRALDAKEIVLAAFRILQAKLGTLTIDLHQNI